MSTASNASPKFELSPVQLIAGCLAAVTAAVLASFFGVAGTIIGTALGSIVGTAGTALYMHSIRTTQARLHAIRTHEQAGGAAGELPDAGAVARAQEAGRAPTHAGWQDYLRRNWVMIAVAAAGVFILAMTAVTGVEAAARKQLWAIVTGHSQPAGPTTTLGGVVGGVSAQPTPTAEPSSNPSPGAPAAAPTSTPGRPTPPPSTSPTPTAIPTVPPPPTTGPTASP